MYKLEILNSTYNINKVRGDIVYEINNNLQNLL